MLPVRSRILLLSAASGVLWAAAWPAIGGMAPLAFVAWLPLLHAERLHDARTAHRPRAFVPYVLPALFIWNLLCSWWFWCVSEPFVTKLISVSAPVLVNTALMAVPWWLKRMVRRPMGEAVAAWGFIFFWLAYERLHHDWDLMWPWFSMGNVFAQDPAWVQWYDHTGMLGGSLWVLLFTLFANRAIAATLHRAPARQRRVPMVSAALVLLVPLLISQLRFHGHREAGRPVEVVVVQPNVDPYDEKFSGNAAEQLERMLEQAAALVTDSTVLVVLPETALQERSHVDLNVDPPYLEGLWENDLAASRSARRIKLFQQRHPGVAVLAGMSSVRLFPPEHPMPVIGRPMGASGYWYISYNAALWMPVDGAVESYHKSRLVAGVELMPFENVLGPLGDLALDLGGTTGSLGQQAERSVLRDASSGIAVVPAICYESVFGEHIAAHVRNGGNLIAIMTNDAWWGTSPGYRQHLSFAALRAIETRRAVARSANTGISGFVDQRGVLQERTTWWTPDARRAQVYLNDHLTFFVRNGDQVGRVAMLFGLLLLLVAIVRGVRGRLPR